MNMYECMYVCVCVCVRACVQACVDKMQIRYMYLPVCVKG